MEKRIPLIAALALALVGRAAAALPDQSLGNLLDAVANGAAVFDGSRYAAPATAAPPVGAAGARPGAALAPATPRAAAKTADSSAHPADVRPTSARGLSDGYIGLYPEDGFVLGSGRCSACRAPAEGKWYFLDDVIATPKAGAPALVWIGSHQMVEGATLSEDGATVRLQDGTVMAFELAPKIAANRSYYDASSLAYLRGRTLRIRGEFVERNGVRTLLARTIWPEDFRIDAAGLQEAGAHDAAGIDALVGADGGGAQSPFEEKLLWQRPGAGRDWQGQPVMGFMVNGAQGDDDESLGGHFSMFTGRVGPHGSMADWMFDNFYDMNSVSEKGIVASLVPMDKYMADLNSGQSWYRPTGMLVMIMKDERVPLEVQEMFKGRYAQYYAQQIKYEHTHENCAALIADPVRQEGWNFPATGGTPAEVARLIGAIVGTAARDPQAGEQIRQSLAEEPTRSFPRAAFDSAGGDVLSLAGAPSAAAPRRELTPLERRIQEDLVAVLFVRLPQIPSSRKFGRDPAGSVLDYFRRVPIDRSKWQTVPTAARPFPPQQ